MSLVGPLEGRFWRILSPRWAHAPLSGEGAARLGGRWNPPGVKALYLSAELETAVAEYQQELNTRPGTFVAYDVAGARVASIVEPRRLREVGLEAGDAVAPWKEIAWVRKQTPAGWALFDKLEGRADGLLVPSAQRVGGVNLVLWRWNETGGPTVSHHDPREELPR
ncbi:MAG TPA: RES domain-containing protein [Caulobacteraceae bacterium]